MRVSLHKTFPWIQNITPNIYNTIVQHLFCICCASPNNKTPVTYTIIIEIVHTSWNITTLLYVRYTLIHKRGLYLNITAHIFNSDTAI